MNLWIVGRTNSAKEIAEHNGHTWDLIGVCASEELAVDACKDESYYIGPIKLNEILPKEQLEWIGAYFPLGRSKKTKD